MFSFQRKSYKAYKETGRHCPFEETKLTENVWGFTEDFKTTLKHAKRAKEKHTKRRKIRNMMYEQNETIIKDTEI